MLWFVAWIGFAAADEGQVPAPEPIPIPDTIPDAPTTPIQVPGAAPISLDLVNADIHGVLRLFGQFAKLNIVAGDDVSGTITIQLNEVPWDQAFQMVLLSKGLQAVWMDPGAVWVQSQP
jgi:type II secretory pathway component HofQ